jgi:hypothetical protein
MKLDLSCALNYAHTDRLVALCKATQSSYQLTLTAKKRFISNTTSLSKLIQQLKSLFVLIDYYFLFPEKK